MAYLVFRTTFFNNYWWGNESLSSCSPMRSSIMHIGAMRNNIDGYNKDDHKNSNNQLLEYKKKTCTMWPWLIVRPLSFLFPFFANMGNVQKGVELLKYGVDLKSSIPHFFWLTSWVYWLYIIYTLHKHWYMSWTLEYSITKKSNILKGGVNGAQDFKHFICFDTSCLMEWHHITRNKLT